MACGDNIRGDAADDDAPGADHGSLADPDAGSDDRAAADPGVLSDHDRKRVLEPGRALVGVGRVRRCIQVDAGPSLVSGPILIGAQSSRTHPKLR